MALRSLHLALMRGIAQRRIRRSPDPVQRAFAIVVVARTIADMSAIDQARRGAPSAEFSSAERVLNAAIEHLRQVRAATTEASTPDRVSAGHAELS